MKNFKISNLWLHKQKQTTEKTKSIRSTHHKTNLVKDEWDMSPEDALRVPYSGHK
jgi:hypothetical protein